MTWRQDYSALTARLDAIGFDVQDYRISVYRALLFAGTVVLVISAGRLANLVIRRFFARLSPFDPAQRLLGEKVLGIAVWLLLILIGADFLHINLTALKIFSGAFGLAVGFGLQKTFGNLISGLILLMDRSIKPGDVIAVGSGADKTVGQVNRIGIRAVSVITRDRIEYLIPNEHLMITTVENWSASSRDVRVKVPVPIAYGTDLDLAERLILAEVNRLPRVLQRHEPNVWLSAFTDSALLFEVQFWIDDPEDGLGNLKSDLLKGLWKAFTAHGIDIPFPQREVHFRNMRELEKIADG